MRVDFTLDTNAENFVDWVQKYAEARQSEQIEYGNAEGVFTVAALETSPSGLNMEVSILVQPIDNGKRGSTIEFERINLRSIPRVIARTVPEPLPVIPPPIILEIISLLNITSKVRVLAESKTVKAFDYFISLIEGIMKDFPESTTDIGKGLGLVNISSTSSEQGNVIAPAQQVIKLYEIFKERFGIGELQSLCLHLGIDHDDYAHLGKSEMALELARDIYRHKLMGDLVAEVGPDLRPDIDWTTIET